jgi:hypothetical protein
MESGLISGFQEQNFLFDELPYTWDEKGISVTDKCGWFQPYQADRVSLCHLGVEEALIIDDINCQLYTKVLGDLINVFQKEKK